MAVAIVLVAHNEWETVELRALGFTQLGRIDDGDLRPEGYSSRHPKMAVRPVAAWVNCNPGIDVSVRDDSSQDMISRYASGAPRPAQSYDLSIPGELIRSTFHSRDSAKVNGERWELRRCPGYGPVS